MRIIAIIIPIMWGTVIFGHGKEKHEPKIIDDHKMTILPRWESLMRENVLIP